LKKLVTNENELKTYLKAIKVKQWIFVTPGYKKKDIVRHCQGKVDEYRKLNLSILDSTFDVLIYDIDFFATEIPFVLDYRKQKIEINPLTQKSEPEIADWKSQKILLVENAIRKHGQRITASAADRDKKINRMTQHSIEHFLNGNITVKIMQEKFPKDYEKFIRVVSLFEKKVTEICVTNTGDNNLW